ncbi:MAG: hypothetical protein LIP11_18245 [Clostridiales bacterium]|nr:hypothetical protein [Clostridiales bacterium]
MIMFGLRIPPRPACFTTYNTHYSISKSQGLIQYYMGTLMNDKPSYASLCIGCGRCEQRLRYIEQEKTEKRCNGSKLPKRTIIVCILRIPVENI